MRKLAIWSLFFLLACEQSPGTTAGRLQPLARSEATAPGSTPSPQATPAPPADPSPGPTAGQAADARAQLAILADETARLAAWRKAAHALGDRFDAKQHRLRDWPLAQALKPAELRRTVKLLQRRLELLCGPDSTARQERDRLSTLGALARSLAHIAPKQAAATLKRHTPCVCATRPRFRTDRDPESWCAWFFAVRAELGEETALDDYAGWLGALNPERVRMAEAFIFLPAWRHPDHPAIAALLVGHFGPGSEASPWMPLISTAPGPDLVELVASPLLSVPVFRDHVRAQLDDHSLALPPDPTRRPRVYDPPAGARVCDLYAKALGQIQGMPAFDLQWPAKRRDAAMAAMGVFLDAHGPELGETDRRPARDQHPALAFGQQMLAKLNLDKPIMAGGGRPVALPASRVRALWRKVDAPKPIFGWVHSGEERLVHGQPKRFYRFVWEHGVERLPAEDLAFSGPGSFYGQQNSDLGPGYIITFGWPDPKANQASGSLEYQPFPPEPGHGLPWKSAPDVVYRADKPLWMNVSISNRSGYDQTAPAWNAPLAADRIPAGIAIQLVGPEGPVPRRAPATARAADTRNTLLPGQSERLFKLDLNAHFRIRQAGDHHLKLNFAGDPDLPAGEVEQQFNFQLGAD